MMGDTMKRALAVVMSFAFLFVFAPFVDAASCPPEVAKAKDMLTKKTSTARGQEVQAPRSLAGARTNEVQAPRGQEVQAPRGQEVQAPRGQEVQAPRGQEVQAPRGQEVQAPRGQEVQAPRGQEVQAPRGQEVQAPRGQEVQAPRSLAGSKVTATPITQATELIKDAEAACKAGDMKAAKTKADAAISVLK
jgi:hypothetical protein